MTPAKRPPRPRCAICGKRFYDYAKSGERVCSNRACKKSAFALAARPAARSVSTLAHAFPTSEAKGDRRGDFEFFKRKTGRRRKRTDPEISALEKRRNFEAWAGSKGPEYIKAMKRFANAKWRAGKLLADPDYFNKKYQRLRSEETLRKARERDRKRGTKAQRRERASARSMQEKSQPLTREVMAELRWTAKHGPMDAAGHRWAAIDDGPMASCSRCRALFFAGNPEGFSTDSRRWTTTMSPCTGERQ